jgi:hypothetical protein
VILIAAGTGCRKSQFNINQNPNDPTDSSVTFDVVLPAALHASGAIVAGNGIGSWGTIQCWMGYWSRSGTYAPNVIEETYQITTGFGNAIWNACYDNNYDYNIVQQKAAVAGAGFYEGVARIMKAQNFQILVDVYGDVPYTQALKGSANPTPSYDDDLAIYKDLLRQIDTGIALIKAAVVTTTGPNRDIAKNDILFSADKTKWAKLGNTLKLRMLVHAYAHAGIDKAAEIAKIDLEGNGYLAADATIQPTYAADKPMPFYGNYKVNAAGGTPQNQVYYAANKWGLDYYTWNGDARRNVVYDQGTSGFVGVPYGLPPNDANARAKVAGVGVGLYKTNASPQLFFSLAEAFLLRAEARARGFITNGPTTAVLLRDGIIASFTYLGVPSPTAAVDAYILGNAGYPDVDITASAANTGYDAGPGGLGTILTQKWYAMNGVNSLEAWTDYRRVPMASLYPGRNATHFEVGLIGGYTSGPLLSVSPQLPPGSQIPVRFLYPQTEYNYNPANVPAGITPLSKVFWDLN